MPQTPPHLRRTISEQADKAAANTPQRLELEGTKSHLGDSGESGWLNIHSWCEERKDPYALPQIPQELPKIPGYRTLREIGRGGMGVVYAAMQERLNRPVALKMILRGTHATEEERLRFLIEAEMLARVKHPNIVQVHEVGSFEGFTFLSLEFIEGGTLAEHIDGKPQPPKDAAALMVLLADAVQAAHSQGVIHRDLKPGNILLHQPASQGRTEHSEDNLSSQLHSRHPRYGIPKITDFGLAKRYDNDSHLTTTGHILGTPSYMAPEQAQGQRNIGPAADIYALGTLLYELLTGDPPFRGGNSMETLRKVLNDEPPPLNQPGRSVPVDLEVICFKCLEKDPKLRYPSAAALAEDLKRYLRDEPISARPITAVERWWRWCRRHPDTAGLVAGLIFTACLGLAGVVWNWRDAVAQRRAAEVALADSERHFEQAIRIVEEIERQIADLLLSRLIDETEELQPTAITSELRQLEQVRGRILKHSWDKYQQFLKEREHDAKLKLAAVRVARKLIPVQRRALIPDLSSVEIYAQAHRLADELVAENPQSAVYRLEWAHLMQARGQLFLDEATVTESLEQAERHFKLAIAASEESLRIAPSDDAVSFLAMAEYRLYLTESLLNRPLDSRRRAIERFVSLRRERHGRESDNPLMTFELGGAMVQLSRFYFFTGSSTEAIIAADEGQEVLAKLSTTTYRPAFCQLYRYRLCETKAKSLEQLDGSAAALSTWQLAEEFCPPDLRCLFLTQYAYTAALAGETKLAQRLTHEMLQEGKLSEDCRYNAFCIYATAYQTANDAAEEEQLLELAKNSLATIRIDPPLSQSARARMIATQIETAGLRHHPHFIALRRELDRAGLVPAD